VLGVLGPREDLVSEGDAGAGRGDGL
jgi:hypothetical protein